MKPLFEGSEWSFPLIQKTWDTIDKIGKEDFNLDYYPIQIEIISAEQMLDCYSSHALPIFYNHWSFGKSFIKNYENYKRGRTGLAYEVVINTDPCIAYLQEDNTMTMQTLVLAHAGVGHNSFFKNNYMFKDWTDAKFIIPYLKYAKDYIAKAEQSLGKEIVELILDAAHALQYNGIFKYKRRHIKADEELERIKNKIEHEENSFNDLWRTIPKKEEVKEHRSILSDRLDQIYRNQRKSYNLPEENILYFLEKHSPSLCDTSREIIRIVRNIAQYFYPQMQTKLMNEGWATFIHYEIMTDMEKKGLITSGSYLEFLRSHSGVIFQPTYDKQYYSGINVYALGFAIFKDLQRIIVDPTKEDKQWFPEIAGKKDWNTILQEIAYNFKDESFILQYLSPKVIRDFKLFAFKDDDEDPTYEITGISRDEDVEEIRDKLSNQYNIGLQIPNIEVVDYDYIGDRSLTLRHTQWNGVPLDDNDCDKTLAHVEFLWGYEVDLEEESN